MTTTTTTKDPRLWTSITPLLSPWILDAMSTMGFTKMTPVQASTIPLFLGNKDVVVEAVTGSGKTLAFLIPMIERITRIKGGLAKGQVGGIVISPTRELATQIFDVCEKLLKFYPVAEQSSSDDEATATATASSCSVRPQLLVGGTSSPAQDIKHFLSNSCNFIIATPGRLNDLLASPYVHTSSFEVLVMDEADRLLSLGFKDTLMRILSRLPKQRRTGLFSASVTEAVEGVLGWAGIRNGVRVNVKVRGEKNEERRTPVSLDIGYIVLKPSQKLFYLPQILSSTSPLKTIVYFATCHAVDYFSHLLPVLIPSFKVIPLHGKQTPNARNRNFSSFVSSASPCVLITTDLAARGLDIPDVDLVIQLDPPQDPKQFLHRCGRSGRAGRRGKAIVMLTCGREEEYVALLKVRKTPVRHITTSEIQPPSDATIKTQLAKLRKLVVGDRAIYEKGMRGFVSWVRSYRSHVAASIFRVDDVNWDETARGWALVKMPRMLELKGKAGVDLQLDGLQVNVDKIAYKDKAREKQRLAELQSPEVIAANVERKREMKAEQTKRNAPWSGKAEDKEVKDGKRERKRKRKEVEKRGNMTAEEKAKDDEWRGLVEEVKRMKKVEREDKQVKGAVEEEFWDGIKD